MVARDSKYARQGSAILGVLPDYLARLGKDVDGMCGAFISIVI